MEIKALPLSFCSREACNIVNNEVKEYIINKIAKYGIHNNFKRAYILNPRSVYFLEKTQHIISIKSSGTNYYLFLTNINNTNYCFYIDRKIKEGYTYPRIISVKYGFDDTIFNDTLIDGELIRNNENPDKWIFLITDLMVDEGTRLKCNIIERFDRLYYILKNNYKENHEIDICPLVVKKLFLYKDYDYLITQFIPSLKYRTNGLYFNSLNVKHANQLYLFPNKNKNKISQKKQHSKQSFIPKKTLSKDDLPVFKIIKTEKPDVYELLCNNRNEEYKYGIACITSLRTSKFINKILYDKQFGYVNCKYNEKFKKYEPISQSSVDNNASMIDLSKLN